MSSSSRSLYAAARPRASASGAKGKRWNLPYPKACSSAPSIAAQPRPEPTRSGLGVSRQEPNSLYPARSRLPTLIRSMASLSPSPASSYRGRLAPSPTGYLHVGHARSFWTAAQRARAAGGTRVMRMEDPDPDRSRQAYAEAAMEDLRWLGIRWQEGPDTGGPCAPYAQSQRKSIYLDAWRKLLRGGFLFPCRCSRKDLEAALAAPHESIPAGANGPQSDGEPSNGDMEPLDDEPVYPGTCRPSTDVLLINNSDLGSRFPTLSPGKRRKDGARGSNSHPLDFAASEIEETDGFNWRFRVRDWEVSVSFKTK